MSLQFVIGSSGSGKSTKLFNDIIKKSLEKPHEQFIFIVPDQFTMETQEKIVELHPYQSVMNIDVLSFKRLAYKVFGELSINWLLYTSPSPRDRTRSRMPSSA